MPAVKIGVSRQVVIPKKIHDRLGLRPGDYLDVELKQSRIVLTPKSLVERRLAEGLEDLDKGRVYGPFESAEEVVASLHRRRSSKKAE
jgi:AbrB family looped-hinge helix DNA binding protein